MLNKKNIAPVSLLSCLTVYIYMVHCPTGNVILRLTGRTCIPLFNNSLRMAPGAETRGSCNVCYELYFVECIFFCHIWHIHPRLFCHTWHPPAIILPHLTHPLANIPPYLAYTSVVTLPHVASPPAIILQHFAYPTAIIQSQLANSSAIINFLNELE